MINVALGAFGFTYKDAKKNILFVSWGANELEYWVSAQRLSLSTTGYDGVRDLVKSRLDETRKRLILDLDLG